MSTSISHSIKGEIKDTLSLSIPLIAAQMVYACSGFIGTAMVAHLGEDALAASILVSMTWMSLSVLFFGILNAVSVLVSHQYGAKNNQAISDIMGQAFILGGIVFIFMVLVLCSMPFFLRFTSQPPEVIRLALDYMHALLWTIPGLVLLVICEQFLAGVNRVKFVLRISLCIVPIEIPLIYVLIFGKFGLPACGVAGIGYGLAITYTATALFLMIYLSKAKYYQKYAVFNNIKRIEWKWLIELVRVGFPMGCMHVIEVSAFALTTFWIAQFGTTLLAAHQIVMQYLSFCITLIFAMSQAVTIRVGHAVGRMDTSGIQYAIYVGMGLSFVCIVLVAFAFYLFPLFFLRLDINIHDANNALLMQYASALLAIAGVLMLFDNFRIIGFGALRGLKDTKFPMYASFISFWIIGIAIAYLLGFLLDFAGKGIWWGQTIGIACGAALVFWRLHYLLQRIDLNKLMTIQPLSR